MSHEIPELRRDNPLEISDLNCDAEPRRAAGPAAKPEGNLVTAPALEFYQHDDVGQITTIISCTAPTVSIRSYV